MPFSRTSTAFATLVLALSASPAPAQPVPRTADPVPWDPGVKAVQFTADSLVDGTRGRYGVMALDLHGRTSYVKSEGGYFDCEGFQLLPVACAVCWNGLPTEPVWHPAPDSLILEAWGGDSAACEALAASIGRSDIERWLDAGGLEATMLDPESATGLPWISSPWDCMVMLAEMDVFSRGLPAGLDAIGSGLDQGLVPEGATALGCAQMTSDGCRFTAAFFLPGGREVGLSLLADSMESVPVLAERLELLAQRLCAGGMAVGLTQE